MLSRHVRILNFDDSVLRQSQILDRFQPTIIDLKKIGPSCRLWCNQKSSNEIRRSLKPELKNTITFLGSGDFHHVTSLLLEQFPEPLTVIVFDQHPDWDILPPRLGCGSWVTQALRRPNVRKVVLFGIASGDISSFSLQTGNLSALEDDRVEIYPYQHAPTMIFLKKIPARSRSVQIEHGLLCNTIRWRALKDHPWQEIFPEILRRLTARQVYLSIDKDCLSSEYALTNWEEGCLKLTELIAGLELVRKNLDIVGCDITGDYSPAQTQGIPKGLLSRWDHPKDFSAQGRVPAEISRINEQTNLRILETLTASLAERVS